MTKLFWVIKMIISCLSRAERQRTSRDVSSDSFNVILVDRSNIESDESREEDVSDPKYP